MTVFRWGQHWHPFHDLEREVEGLLKRVNASIHGLRFGRQFPAVNLYELKDEFLLTAELPGITPDCLEITIAGGILTLKGERKVPEDCEVDRFRRRERYCGSWQRSLNLPEKIQEEKLAAEFNNGILRIHLPRAEEIKPRRIPVIEGKD